MFSCYRFFVAAAIRTVLRRTSQTYHFLWITIILWYADSVQSKCQSAVILSIILNALDCHLFDTWELLLIKSHAQSIITSYHNCHLHLLHTENMVFIWKMPGNATLKKCHRNKGFSNEMYPPLIWFDSLVSYSQEVKWVVSNKIQTKADTINTKTQINLKNETVHLQHFQNS